MNVEALKQQLVEHEGLRLFPYRDTVGKLTLGVGRNLDDVGISEGEALMLLENDVAVVLAQLDQHAPWWRTLDEVRQRVLADAAFNLGITRLLKFRNTLSALLAGDFEDAANGLKASKWFGQVGRRGPRLVAMMRTGAEVPL